MRTQPAYMKIPVTGQLIRCTDCEGAYAKKRANPIRNDFTVVFLRHFLGIWNVFNIAFSQSFA